jgi:hypothetical protein
MTERKSLLSIAAEVTRRLDQVSHSLHDIPVAHVAVAVAGRCAAIKSLAEYCVCGNVGNRQIIGRIVLCFQNGRILFVLEAGDQVTPPVIHLVYLGRELSSTLRRSAAPASLQWGCVLVSGDDGMRVTDQKSASHLLREGWQNGTFTIHTQQLSATTVHWWPHESASFDHSLSHVPCANSAVGVGTADNRSLDTLVSSFRTFEATVDALCPADQCNPLVKRDHDRAAALTKEERRKMVINECNVAFSTLCTDIDCNRAKARDQLQHGLETTTDNLSKLNALDEAIVRSPVITLFIRWCASCSTPQSALCCIRTWARVKLFWARVFGELAVSALDCPALNKDADHTKNQISRILREEVADMQTIATHWLTPSSSWETIRRGTCSTRRSTPSTAKRCKMVVSPNDVSSVGSIRPSITATQSMLRCTPFSPPIGKASSSSTGKPAVVPSLWLLSSRSLSCAPTVTMSS